MSGTKMNDPLLNRVLGAAENEKFSAEQKLKAMKQDAFDKLRAAEKAWYAYFVECEVGPEREWAHGVYCNLLYAARK